jgi:hypothetical protein
VAPCVAHGIFIEIPIRTVEFDFLKIYSIYRSVQVYLFLLRPKKNENGQNCPILKNNNMYIVSRLILIPSTYQRRAEQVGADRSGETRLLTTLLLEVRTQGLLTVN